MKAEKPTSTEEFDWLNVEERLRGLSPPVVPANLEAKLLASIPRASRVQQSGPPSNRKTISVVLPLAAALLISTALFVALSKTQIAEGPPVPAWNTDPPTVVSRPLSKETDPCNILPPLSDWRS